MIDIIASLVPVCPDCARIMIRRDWNTPRPNAICLVCERVHYYSVDGRIVMSAKVRRVA